MIHIVDYLFILKPTINDILVPVGSPPSPQVDDLPGTNAILTGKFKSPDLKFLPNVNTIPIPDKDKLGPIAASIPLPVLIPTKDDNAGKNIPCSIPPTTTTHSTNPATSPLSTNLVSHYQPYCDINAIF